MASGVVADYIVPPRLAAAKGQLMQGDILTDVPFIHVVESGDVALQRHLGLLLTPTCDFAVKATHPERQVALIESLGAADRRRDQWQSSSPPRHLFLLSPIADVLPYGGLAHFRRAQEVPAVWLEQATRVATLSENSLRRLLTEHTAYYTRGEINPETIPIAEDDPRMLWSAIDAAQAEPAPAHRRTLIGEALQKAIQAVARHHGISAPSPAMALVWLEQLTKKKVLPVSTRKAVRELAKAQRTVLDLYKLQPSELLQKHADHHQLVKQLEGIGALLQEKAPQQLTPQVLHDVGLTNLFRS